MFMIPMPPTSSEMAGDRHHQISEDRLRALLLGQQCGWNGHREVLRVVVHRIQDNL
jgi:hypothetical protein